MTLSNFGKTFLWTTRIDLDEENFIELREPNQAEIVNLSDDGTKNLQMLGQILPDCIVKSSFTNEDGTPAKGKDIADALKQSGSLFTEILTTWLESIPFQHRLMKEQKSDK